MECVAKELEARSLLPVRFVVAPSPQHHLALARWQEAFPSAAFLCGAASGQMPPLTRKRRDLRFAGVVSAAPKGAAAGNVVLASPVPDRERGADASGEGTALRALMLEELNRVFEIAVLDDNRSGEIVLLHRASGTLIISDLLYKSTPEVVGPGGTTGAAGETPQQHAFTAPSWFAEGQEELFYGRPTDNSGRLLPSYRTHPRMRTIDVAGMRTSLELLLGWQIERAVCCHTDPIEGGHLVRQTLRTAWGWLWGNSHAEAGA